METTIFLTMKEVSRSEIESWLSLAGLEMTPQRFAVLDLLIRGRQARTSADIVAALRRKYPRPSHEAIHRTLYTLRDAGVVKEILSEDGVTRYISDIAEDINKIRETLEDD